VFAKSLIGKVKKPETDEDTLEAMSTVLSLSAVIGAYHYDVPEFLPPCLVHLAKFAGFKAPIDATVKKAFSDFWKSHQDNWILHKEKFTEDELSIISNLKSSNQYFV
jgi:hypothetical protein